VEWLAAQVRAYLEGHGDALPLRPVIKRHGELVFVLNSWERDSNPRPHGRRNLTLRIGGATLGIAARTRRKGTGRILRPAAGADGAKSQIPMLHTNLSGDAGSRGRDGIRKGERKLPDTANRMARVLAPPECRRCGTILELAGRVYCDACLPELDAVRTQHLVAAGRATLARMRASENDPARSPEARAKRSESVRRRNLELAEWARTHKEGIDHEEYETRIRPRLDLMTVPELQKVTGLSRVSAWRIRRGEQRLHPRFWSRLLVGSD